MRYNMSLSDQPEFDTVKGFLDEGEGRRLYELALSASKYAPCLEIGSYCGKSTLCLGLACKENGSALFSIDHHRGSEDHQPGEAYFDPALIDLNTFQIDTFQTFRQTIRKSELENTVIPIVSRSQTCARYWQIPISLLFIDGGHSFRDVFVDYQAWVGHLLPDGYLLFHDIFKTPDKGGQGPYHVYQLAMASGLFKELPTTNTLGVLQRRSLADAPNVSTLNTKEGSS
jgi:MMP 1-O-methyltransferase